MTRHAMTWPSACATARAARAVLPHAGRPAPRLRARIASGTEGGTGMKRPEIRPGSRVRIQPGDGSSTSSSSARIVASANRPRAVRKGSTSNWIPAWTYSSSA